MVPRRASGRGSSSGKAHGTRTSAANGAQAARLVPGAEDVVPQRSADSPASLRGCMVVEHVPTPQESPDPRARTAAMRREMEVVVGEEAHQEEREEGRRPWTAQDRAEQRVEDRAGDNRGRG